MIIGVNTSHDVSYSVLDEEGHLLYLLEEERFNRIKHTEYFSFLGLEFLIEDSLLDPEKVKVLAYSFENGETEVADLFAKCEENVRRDFGDAVLARARTNYGPHYGGRSQPYWSATQGLGQTREFDETDRALRALFPNAEIESYNHHLAHAASAFYPSPFEESAVLVVDGAGRLETTSIWRADASGIEHIEQVELPHSLGVFYWLVSHVLALEEGKVMGLAAYGTPRFADVMRERILSIEKEGGFKFVAPLVFWFDMSPDWACEELLTRIPITPRYSDSDPLTQEHADFAASAQLVTEEVMLHLSQRARLLTGLENLCLAGGVIQNCVALGKIVQSRLFSRYWIQPVPHDSGSAWGAALLAAAKRQSPARRDLRDTAFLGRPLTDTEIHDALRTTAMTATPCSDVAHNAAKSLVQGKIIGWSRNRAEVGPRALGARSLIGHPRFRLNHFRMNRIKSRESWRPLAPVFRTEDLKRFVVDGIDSPHMNLSFTTQPLVSSVLPAAVHVDGTARIQTVSAQDSGGFYEILSALEDLGAEPALINTSFNGRGEPLVQTAIEALRFFMIGELDELYLEDWCVASKPLLPPEVIAALRTNPYLSLYQRDTTDYEVVLLQSPEAATLLEPQFATIVQSLGWMGTRVHSVAPHDVESVLKSPTHTAILTRTPALDLLSLLDGNIESLQAARWIFVSDTLYPTVVPFEELCAWVIKNLNTLQDWASNRTYALWMSPALQERFTIELPFSAQNVVYIDDSNPKIDFEKQYLILSLDTYDSHRHQLESWNCEPFRDYSVWLAKD